MNGNILITGGSGFLGRAIMLIARTYGWDTRFTIYSRDELKQDKCHREFPDARYVLGDICDTDRLMTTMIGHDIVIHAAALKYIPEGELNASECIRVNINGAQSVIKAARAASIPMVIGISTDKAVSPVNVYGMSKAIMERLFAEASTDIRTKFVCCRYGNVIGSTGSVIPLFQRLIKTKGRLPVTDPTMTRFWISYREAVDLVRYSITAPSGCVVIPQPKAMMMMDLAKSIAQEAPIDIVGIRPGEKMHEDLLNEQESARTVLAGAYYHLMPVGYKCHHKNEYFPSTLKSSSPYSWITVEEMQRLIQESERV